MNVARTIELMTWHSLNQVTYCPRLYYLPFVDRVMPGNEHVEAGLHAHRRVDALDRDHRARIDGDSTITRGVQLASEFLGLAGTLD